MARSRGSWMVTGVLAGLAAWPGTAVAQRPAQATIGVSVTVLPPPPPPTMDAVLVQPPPAATMDSVTAADPRRKVRVLAWVGT